MDVIKKIKHKNVIFNLYKFEKINARIKEIDYSSYSKEEFSKECQRFREKINGISDDDSIVVEAFSLIKEAIYRVLNIHPFDVQVVAGLAMFYGNFIEMKTGEGKTLTGVFPVCLNALLNKQVDVLTANDYLAKRDSEWMGRIYHLFGLTVGYINEGMTLDERKEVYKNDIVYLTVKEAGFGYLKNFLCMDKEDYIDRKLEYALIDEADSILIDEARIPLVIAGEIQGDRIDQPSSFIDFIRSLEVNEDFEVMDFNTNISLTDRGIVKCESFLDIENLYSMENIEHLMNVTYALEAEILYKKDVDYVVKNDAVYQVDAITGRVAHNRKWPDGLQEAIEWKEGIMPKVKCKILSQISIENYIKLYSEVSGMTGTLISSASEIYEKYGYSIVEIPTHKACIRIDREDSIYIGKAAKYKAIINEIEVEHERQRPVLVATSSIEESFLIFNLLRDKKIECNLLNAKNDEVEAQIIADAGNLGTITISTNMAGRGTDIKLGGRDEKNRDAVMGLGGLYVIGTNRHDSIRMDDQLIGRSGRQGDRGESKFFLSLEDDLMMKTGLDKSIPKELYPDDDSPFDGNFIRKRMKSAQRIAQGENQRIRKNITSYSELFEKQRKEVFRIRQEILFGGKEKDFVWSKLPMLRKEELGDAALKRAQQQVLLYLINKYWAFHIENADYLRQTIHLVNIGKKDPVAEYNAILYNDYKEMMEGMFEEALRILSNNKIGDTGIDMDKEGLGIPSSTFSYLLDDSPEALGMDHSFDLSALVLGPLVIPAMILKKILLNQKRKRGS